MIRFSLNPASVTDAIDHIDQVKQRVLVGVRLGMRDGLRALGHAEAEAVAGHSKTGLLEKILDQGGKVIDTGNEVSGVYRPRNAGKQPHYWLQYGVKVPATEKLMKMQIGSDSVFTSSRKAFEVSAKPYFFDTAEGFAQQFFDILQARVNEALEA